MWRVLRLTFVLVLLPAAALAQNWPERPVRLIVPYSAGGGTDIVARVLAQKFGERLGQRFFVENRPGAGGNIGAQVVAKAETDGYTLLVGSPAEIAINPSLFKDLTFDPLKDLTPITLLAWTPLVLAAHPSFEAASPAEFVKFAQSREVNYSTPGIGSVHHLTGEYINKLQSTKLVHVPYRGAAPAVSDAVAGQVKLTISGMPPVVGFLQSGTLKAIAVTSRQRSPLFPDVPTMAETKGFEEFDFTNWFGLLARTGTPAHILDKLNKAAVEALSSPQVREVLNTQAAEVVGNSPEQFREFIHAEATKYSKIIQLTGVTIK